MLLDLFKPVKCIYIFPPEGPLIKSLRDLIKLALRNSKNSQDQVPAIFSRLQGIGVTQTTHFIFLYHVFMTRIVLKCIIWVNITSYYK